MTKLSSSKKILLASLLIGVLIIGAVVTVVLVLAASTQNVASNVQVTYKATEVGGTIEFSQMKAGESFSAAKSVTFDGSETTTNSGDLSPDAAIELSSSQNYAVFRYKITGYSDEGFYVSLEYKDMQEADKNTAVSYTVSSSEISDYENLTKTVPVGTITKNNNYANGETTYIYVRVKIANLNEGMAYSGAYTLVLSREAWTDTNHDSTTGIDYGYVENTDGTPYAAAVGYSGSADEITVDTTSVYGSEMPVVVIKDFAFSTRTSPLSTGHAFAKVTIGNSVKTIEGYAFAYNTTLSEVSIGKNTTSIATTAFEGCTGLLKIANKSEIEINSEDYGFSSSVVISTPLEMKTEVWNGTTYYYVEMGEYPQTFAGYTASVGSTWTTTGETIKIDLSGTKGASGYGTANTEYAVYSDGNGGRYIKHTVAANSTSYKFMGNGGTTKTTAGEAWFKLEPIKWDVVGYYTDDNKTTFVKVSDTTNFDPDHKENIVVKSRDALQGMVWNSENTDVDYIASDIQGWLRNFEDNFLSEYKDTYIEQVTNDYNDTNETDKSEMTGNTAPVAGSVDEYAWLMTYDQAKNWFTGSTDSTTTRAFSPSDFALATRAYQSTNTSYTTITKPNGGTCYWWLRSSFDNGGDYCAGVVTFSGLIHTTFVYYNYYAVVPAMLINL